MSGREILRAARAGGYAVPAFNIFNLEMLQAAYRAGEAERAPVIVQVSPRSVAYAGLRPLAMLARTMAEATSVPIALHLDHGPDPAACRAALEAGFTSVTSGGGDLSYAENVRRMREVVAVAHAANAAAEPGVDALAVAIGTVHGMTSTGAVLDLARIAGLVRNVGAALVMRGSSGVDDETLQRAVEAGIRKVNLSTALQKVFMETRHRHARPRNRRPRLGHRSRAPSHPPARRGRTWVMLR